jgi:hypothetical protein
LSVKQVFEFLKSSEYNINNKNAHPRAASSGKIGGCAV